MVRFLLPLLLFWVSTGTSLAQNKGSRPACNPACLRIYLPVCGSDGQTYPNDCVFKYYQCLYGNVTYAYEGECASCPRVCPFTYFPVCGSDGTTYPNACALAAAACTTNPSITLKHQGRCRPPCPQSCPGDYSPVCGSDGQTYGNKCTLDLVSCRDFSVTLAGFGVCGSLFTGCPDVCSEEEDPVCGSDGVTYKNECVFKAATCRDVSGTTPTSTPGECATKPDDDCPVLCPAIYTPVCGTDGNTYANLCVLKSESCYVPNLTAAFEGECDKNPNDTQVKTPTRSFFPQLPQAPPILPTTSPPPTRTFTLLPPRFLCPNTCILNYKPVCGSDGRTYINDCILALVECRQRKGLYLVYEGMCL